MTNLQRIRESVDPENTEVLAIIDQAAGMHKTKLHTFLTGEAKEKVVLSPEEAARVKAEKMIARANKILEGLKTPTADSAAE